MKYGNHIRPSKELEKLINYIKARHMLEGLKVPSTAIITKKISEMINKEDLWHEFIKE